MSEAMQAVNPDTVCQRALQSRMAAYEAKEHFEAVLKGYNDQVAALINLVGLMKGRILELEKDVASKQAQDVEAVR